MQQKRSASMMGAAETRALWQRMASRCCVQEDVKRAPKLACCQQQSSLASAKHLHPETSVDTLSSTSFGDASYGSDFSSDTKWWLKGSLGSQFITSLEDDLEILNPGFMNSFFEDIKCNKLQEFVDMMETREEGNNIEGKLKEMYFQPVESPWMPTKKSLPWWRSTTDEDELALLVASKSLDHIENCDLPPPQKVHNNRIHSPSGTTPIREMGFLKSVNKPWEQEILGKTENMEDGYEKTQSYRSRDSKNVSPKSTGNDLNKAQLLEALCHSQTRAREAEKAAREANTEKDHIITLLFRQASQLFAYKQWFQLLQLETLYLQIKNKEKQISGRNPRKRWQRSKHGGVGRYVMAFALGFSLIGAGLLLGWTVASLLPF